ncbi:MAG: UDP-N-acetylmuramoyl-L-alanine--D-glutamate ligase [Proteobacteria bacterium]|nr:UDP-N-acetylmuramoyl-L-alanine--D-glutamate ligase [Pseudomonadota bacterium]
MALAGKRVLVLGLGDTGLSVARWVAREGGLARVADTRVAPPRLAALRASVPAAEAQCGAFSPRLLEGVDLLCVSPGLSLEEAVVRAAVAAGVPVCGDIELFAWGLAAYGRPKVLAITGTNGKTTVTSLCGHLLRGAGVDAEVAGNIAPPALDALRARLDAGRLPGAWVLELSSYQLETTWSLAPDAAAMLNLTEDHLDRYPGLAAYGDAKARIFQGGGVQVLNRDDPHSLAMAAAGRRRITFGLDAPAGDEDFGCIAVNGAQWIAQGRNALVAVDALPIHGWHNAANVMAAMALARAAGAAYAPLVSAVATFRGLPHRLEKVATAGGVDFYDDSKGTNVGATIAALRGLARTVVLIAGGVGKGQDFTPLAQPVGEYARRVLLIGEDAARIESAIASSGVATERCATLEEAVAAAARHARPGDAVLLSPACASLDMFRDYKHRGDAFAAAARALEAKHG